MTRRADRRPRLLLTVALAAAAAAAAIPGPGARTAHARSGVSGASGQSGPSGQPVEARGILSDRPLPRPGAMLATELARLVRTVTATPVPSPRGLRAGVALAELATDADPDDAENWRLLLFAARLAEDGEAAARAIDALGRLAPEDDVVTLARLQRGIEERGRTIEDRTEFLEFLVDAGREGRLGAAAASRIAYDLALLRQRSSDVEGFAEALLTALELDSSHVAAARTALDFFSTSAGSPVDEAELMVNLILADPTDSIVLEGLARILLSEGAYDGAARLYGIAVDLLSGGSALRQDVAEGLVADQALALWGAGDVDAAIRVIEDRERYKQDLILIQQENRRRREALDPGSTADLPPLPDRLTLETNLSAVRIAILAVEGPSITLDRPAARSAARRVERARDEAAGAGQDAEQGAGETDAEAARRPPVASPAEAHAALLAELRAELDERYRGLIETADQQAQDPLLEPSLRLDHAWAAVSLMDDPATAREQVEAAAALAPLGLSDEAMARFEGWIQLREGNAAAAIATLEPVAEADPLARLGLALAYEADGATAKARVELRGVAVAARGTIAGVVAERRLRVSWGESMQPTATAARLEGLVSTMPIALDRLAWNQTGSLRLRAEFRDRRLSPFAPAILDLTLVNNAPVPLSLDSRGPVVPTVMVVPDVVLSAGVTSPPIIVVDFQRRLRLAPREQVTVSVDLRRTRLGGLLLDATELGANVRAEAFINHDVARRPDIPQPVFYPRAIAADAETGYLRIDGIRIDRAMPDGSIRRSEEVDSMIRAVDGMRGEVVPRLDTLGAVNRLALLRTDERTPPLVLGVRQDAAEAMVAAFPRLDPTVQAWLVATSPTGVSLPQFRTVIERSSDPGLLATWLVNMVGRVDDPVLIAGLASEDSRVRRVAEAVDERLRRSDLMP